MLKRSLDIFISASGLLFLIPVFFIVAACIYLSEGRPIFFSQKRVGLNGNLFNLYKFRTMRKSMTENYQLATSNDNRITKCGHFLRYYKIDELPQLWNVLIGDISLVGYRPEIPYYVEKYTKEQKKILKYKPGIVDPATLFFSRYENDILSLSQDIEKDYIAKILPKKISLSLQYAQSATFLSDIKCLFLCFIKILKK